MMKFKIGFTIDAEALFGLMAKVLPIEEVSVEEITPPAPAQPPARIAQIIAKTPKPKSDKRKNRTFTANGGINSVILETLADGQARTAVSIKPAVKAAGYSPNSTSSRLNALRDRGFVFQPEYGLWRIAAPQSKAAE